MKHYGDITKLSGYDLPVVDVITGGSPCQDLSVAGKRAGLDGERSGLFMEQIRIVKEMRERERANGRTGVLVRPRYCVWENVPGAFSSNGGRDFQAVLSEFVRIAEPDAPDVPMPDNGKWPHSGCIYQKMGGWSIAWRVHDAQFWGVPQRRKRISLVADFGGLSAPEISFERKGLSRDSPESGEARERAAADSGSGLAYSIQGNTVDRTAKQNGLGVSEDVAHTLNAVDRHAVCFPDKVSTLPARMDGSPCIDRGPPVIVVSSNQDHASISSDGVCPTLPAAMGMGGGYIPMIFDARGNGDGLVCPTITGDHENRVTDYTAVCVGNGQLHQMTMGDKANTLDTMHDQQAVLLLFSPEKAKALHAKANLQFREGSETYIVAGFSGGQHEKARGIGYEEGKSPTLRGGQGGNQIPCVMAVDCRNGRINPDVNGTLQAKEQGGTNLNSNNVVLIWPEVRRLMPVECERLQGYPDGWTDIGEWEDSNGKKRKEADTPRYKACGNSIALPFWFWLLRRISAQYERPATLGSLFDGIGGFPLCWERCNGKGTALWASEIEEFAIAVTKKHFPEE